MTVLTNTILVDNSPLPPGGLEPPNTKPSIPGGQPGAPNIVPGHDPNNPAALNYARIGYNNLLTGAEDTNRSKALTPNTFERWTESGSAMAVFSMAAATVDYIGIAAHNLAGKTVTLSTATAAGGPYTQQASITPDSNRAIMVMLSNPVANVVEVRVEITGSTNEIGVVSAGEALIMQRPIYGGHSPQDLSAQVKYQSTMSDTGQFLGRTIIRQGTQTELSWRHLDPQWYRDNFQPFVESAKTKPFFIKWRPDLYSEEVSYSHTTRDIQPTNMGGGHKLMSVSMSIRGHQDTAQPPTAGAGAQSIEALIAGLGV